jgi:glycerol-3-phosphate dehydrogenase
VTGPLRANGPTVAARPTVASHAAPRPTAAPGSDRPASPLERRRADLEMLARERFDLVVVGGGITGAGILLDAVSRGLRAVLVEQDDIASGTSSRSSRLIHGGLRYLEQMRLGLVHEALTERARLVELAPHLVRLEPLVFPLYGAPVVNRLFYGAGLTLYDLLGSARRVGRHHHLMRDRTLELAPVLRREGLRGSIVYHDGVEDDARYALAVARTALAMGGFVVTRARVSALLLEGDRATGVRVHDRVGDADVEIRARHVIDATGVWEADADGPLGPSMRIVPSRGAHLIVDRARIPVRHGMSIRVPGRVFFLVPWPDHWIIGTTDAPYEGPPDRPAASGAEVDELLAKVNHVLQVDLTRADVLGTYAGLRPLVGGTVAGSTVKVSREHRIRADANGLVHISGGKYTTYRIMARDAVQAALGAESASRPSTTATLPIRGAAAPAELRALATGLAREHGLSERVAGRLVDRHGTEAEQIARLGAAEDHLRPLGDGLAQIEAEVVWAAREELALSLDDVLARRARLAAELPDRGATIAPRVAALLGAELGWDAERQAREVDAYLAGAHAEYDVPPPADGRRDVPLPAQAERHVPPPAPAGG